ncbi:MAG: S-ribosylhomocysteine lyase [Herbaspirillum sp.]
MINIEQLGWDSDTVGELDHRLLKAPSVKLRSAKAGENGDIAYSIDLRIQHPNADQYLTSTELHSLEHFLLEGFQRHLPSNFISVGVMGCQTGFYLILLNEGRVKKICSVLEDLLTEMQSATVVPYARIDQCGNFRNHSVERAQRAACRILQAKATWLDIV